MPQDGLPCLAIPNAEQPSHRPMLGLRHGDTVGPVVEVGDSCGGAYIEPPTRLIPLVGVPFPTTAAGVKKIAAAEEATGARHLLMDLRMKIYKRGALIISYDAAF